ncbi:hypothetical protein PHYSODRAFT_300254 [Phytophthora sojae]|uniref:Uncharacterized protein n=1 Tax=Phytophthora sojae (strain P6497) TaxID=1094619 RepID=G4ZFZ9_PHYSP|nr:hypothetical protein PHYSODRAFT_300249 [Phytophthora sojae]XP_009526124.1 hypothetical protein PHYSODRAFT_300254 [Phytophthora sojae]EGZ17056.1 hypothetical protein PHYSODRAFT_300249 [Phytophthora sojae]EGZ17066.1 hypothetical protein PHYSODRAFT_300254 [Phytophthora sojae]|eukprot:XP_009526114.1 hypothetical protein PHYSODRAFT_300249 [Phytophthora sojae]
MAVYLDFDDSRQHRQNAAVVVSVMALVMPLLDAVQHDGSIDMSALSGGLGTTVTKDVVVTRCKKVAKVMKRRFGTPTVEQTYFTFLPRPNFVSHEYGTKSFKEVTRNEKRAFVLLVLMHMMRESKGPTPSNRELSCEADKLDRYA